MMQFIYNGCQLMTGISIGALFFLLRNTIFPFPLTIFRFAIDISLKGTPLYNKADSSCAKGGAKFVL